MMWHRNTRVHRPSSRELLESDCALEQLKLHPGKWVSIEEVRLWLLRRRHFPQSLIFISANCTNVALEGLEKAASLLCGSSPACPCH